LIGNAFNEEALFQLAEAYLSKNPIAHPAGYRDYYHLKDSHHG
jgi:hypothetical protein